jgi:hypothetical protein
MAAHAGLGLGDGSCRKLVSVSFRTAELVELGLARLNAIATTASKRTPIPNREKMKLRTFLLPSKNLWIAFIDLTSLFTAVTFLGIVAPNDNDSFY